MDNSPDVIVDTLSPAECLRGDEQFVSAVGCLIHSLMRIDHCAIETGVDYGRLLSCYIALALEITKQQSPMFAGLLHPRPIIVATQALLTDPVMRFMLRNVVSLAPTRALFDESFVWWKGYVASESGQECYETVIQELREMNAKAEGFALKSVYPPS